MFHGNYSEMKSPLALCPTVSLPGGAGGGQSSPADIGAFSVISFCFGGSEEIQYDHPVLQGLITDTHESSRLHTARWCDVRRSSHTHWLSSTCLAAPVQHVYAALRMRLDIGLPARVRLHHSYAGT